MKRNSKLLLLTISGGIFGACLPLLISLGKLHFFDQLKIQWLQWPLRIVFVLLFLFLFKIFKDSRRFFRQSEIEEDDGRSESQYKKAFLKLGVGEMLMNVYMVLGIFNLSISLFLDLTTHLSLVLFLLDYFLFMVYFLLLPQYKKTIKLLRNYDYPLLAMSKDALNLLNSYDEAEKEILFEENYRIMFQLNQIIFPSLYGVSILVSALTGTFQWFAFLLLVFLHLYINIKEYRSIKHYYR